MKNSSRYGGLLGTKRGGILRFILNLASCFVCYLASRFINSLNSSAEARCIPYHRDKSGMQINGVPGSKSQYISSLDMELPNEYSEI